MSTTPVTAGEADSLVQRLVEDMGRRWRSGERPRAEEYLARWPELVAQPGAALELIYEEVCLRREHDEDVAAEEVRRRFPQWQAELTVLLECHRVLGPAVAGPSFPAAGEALGDFRLLAELGRGAAGRVFLAAQAPLADRPVVLKLVPLAGREHLTLARLQHTHIVPLYAVQDDLDRHLRILCMPYFGGLTLAQLLDALQGRPPAQRTGQDVLAVLRKARAGAPVALAYAGYAGEDLGGLSYTRAVCWVGACLADGLHHAHRRGLVHLDLKPSNVLLAADGTPMLLDFHLARAPVRAGAAPPEWLGGTPRYMAPEQEAALAAVRAGRPVPVDVDGRADVFGLGLLLYEALGGAVPAPSRSPGRALRRRNPHVAVGLADVLGRALAADPRQRYPSAATLAEDLRRHLADLPLRGVRNRSPVERWRKWRRRWPSALVVLSLVVAVLAVGGYAGVGVWYRGDKAGSALEEGRGLLRQERYAEARAALQRGLALVGDSPFHAGLAAELRSRLKLAERGEAVDALHRFVEQVRPLYGADVVPRNQVADVAAHCRQLWRQRDVIAERLTPAPAPGLTDRVQADMLDLALVWTDLRLRHGRRDLATAARQQLVVLDQAESLFGPSCVLDRERQDCAAVLGEEPPPAKAPPPRTPWEHYALGRALLRAGDLPEAERHLEQSLQAQPGNPWPHFHHGRCAYQHGRFDQAVTDFTVCVALAPNSAWCWYNRALVYAERGDDDRALADYDRALDLDPALSSAALNRGMLHYRHKDYARALEDLERAGAHGAAPAVVAYDMALVHVARGDRAAALDRLREALGHDPEHRDARTLLDRLREGAPPSP